ncbi:MAG: sigma-70 family RNA polymerase sigma factor [Lachnospiraceae bacterium]|nr:sigma-70 family RNA polymerase sigma factor [Lachnospiraceae bacterium]
MNRESLGELIVNSTDTMYRIAKTILGKDEDCYDAISESIIKAYGKIHTLKKERYAKTWLIRILINECYQIIRERQKSVSINEYEESIEAPEARDYGDLYCAIMQLPEKLRITIVLYYLEGYSIKEIASLVESTETAIKKRLVRGREALKGYLEEKDYE